MNGKAADTVAIVGAGTMGPGIGAVFARHGFDTRLTDIAPEVLERAKTTVEGVYRALIGADFLTEREAEGARARLRYTLDLAEAAAGADLIVEAIPERLELKQQFFADIERLVSTQAILASNTS